MKNSFRLSSLAVPTVFCVLMTCFRVAHAEPLQDLQKKVATLEAQVSALQKKVDALPATPAPPPAQSVSWNTSGRVFATTGQVNSGTGQPTVDCSNSTAAGVPSSSVVIGWENGRPLCAQLILK